MPDFSNLGQFLKKVRVRHKLTQAEVAAALNMHSQFVSNWERGRCAPPSQKLQMLIELYDINRTELCEAMFADAKIEIREKIGQKAKRRFPKYTALNKRNVEVE